MKIAHYHSRQCREYIAVFDPVVVKYYLLQLFEGINRSGQTTQIISTQVYLLQIY